LGGVQVTYHAYPSSGVVLMSDNEREDWDNLLKSSGFQRLQQWAEQEWAGQLPILLNKAVAAADAQAIDNLRQVLACSKAIDLVMNRPKERLSQLEQQAMAQNTRHVGRGGL
jgi:hypothetical protein